MIRQFWRNSELTANPAGTHRTKDKVDPAMFMYLVNTQLLTSYGSSYYTYFLLCFNQIDIMAKQKEAWDGIERRSRGTERNASDTGQQDEIRSGIKGRIDRLTQDVNPLVFSKDAAQMPELFTHEFALKIRSVRSARLPAGALLTFHRDRIPAGEHVETSLPDEAGLAYKSPQNPWEEVQRPLSGEEMASARITPLAHAVSEALPPDIDLYDKLDEAGKLGFGNAERGLIQTTTMVSASCHDGEWTDINIIPYSELAVPPNMQALHYGGAFFEGMTAEWGEDGKCYVFGLRKHWERMTRGAKRLGVQFVPYEVFEQAIFKVCQQNARSIPRKGRLYLRPHGADVGKQMRVGNSRTAGFFVEATPIGTAESYFGDVERDSDGNVKGKGLIVPTTQIRSAKGLPGDTKGIQNYGPTPVIIREACRLNVGTDKEPHRPVGLLYVDRVTDGLSDEEKLDAEVRETNASNTIFFEDLGDGRYKLVTPTLEDGDILPGNTRALILEKALERGWEVSERRITLRELASGKFVAAGNCGTAAVFSAFDWVHFAKIGPDEATGDFRGELAGGKINIRSQEAINKDPIPQPVKLLMDDVLAVKSARNPSDTAKYLTEVPGIRLK